MGPRSDERGRSLPTHRRSRLGTASMGPRSDERGRLRNVVKNAFSRLLQWGRVRMNAEGGGCIFSNEDQKMLQWGRVRMNAEGGGTPWPLNSFPSAQLGPRSDERGRLARVTPLALVEVLQWGRVRMNAEGTMKFGSSLISGLLQWGRVRMNAEGGAL